MIVFCVKATRIPFGSIGIHSWHLCSQTWELSWDNSQTNHAAGGGMLQMSAGACHAHTIHLLWKIIWQFLKKLNIYLPCDSAILLPYIYPGELEAVFTGILSHRCSQQLDLRVPNWKPPRCPDTGEWMTRLWHVHAMEYSSAIKRK